MAYIPGSYSKAVELQEHHEEKIKKLYEHKIGSSLKELGKLSAFREVFEGIKLEEQEFEKIESVDNLLENKYFIEGRNFGFTLIKNGFNMEMYLNYSQNKKHR